MTADPPAQEAPVTLPPAVVAGIEAVVGERTGTRARVVQVVEQRAPRRAVRTGASFWSVRIGLRPGRLTAFVKLGPRSPISIAVEEYLTDRALPAPRFFGSFEADGLRATVWERVVGYQRRLDRYQPGELARVVGALCDVTAATGDVRERIPPIRGPLWTALDIERLEVLVLADEGLRYLRGALDRFVAVGPTVVEALRSGTPHVLNHNDLKGKNAILGRSGPVWLVDWDQASSGPPGASLRAFALLGGEIEAATAALYVRGLRERGVMVDEHDVLFAMRAQQLLWSLASGIKLDRPEAVAWGLRHVEPTFDALQKGTILG